MTKLKVLISCFYDAKKKNELPVGFSWAETLLQLFKEKYEITILLHGDDLKYGLRSSVYKKQFKKSNPYKKFLKNLHKNGVKIVICEFCLNQEGYNNEQLIDFVKPIKFSVDYIAEAESKGKIVIYDAQKN